MSRKKFENVETVIGPNTVVKGDVEITGAIRIDGKLLGNTTAHWVSVGEKGFVEGNIRATGVMVGGSVSGTVVAAEKIEVSAKGRVKGDLSAPKLVIEEGGVLDGRSLMQGETAEQKDLEEATPAETG